MSRILTLVCFCILTASCASTNSSSLVANESSANHVNRLVDVAMGESLELDGSTWLVERSYFAASGRLCKRLRGSSGELRVGCQNLNKDWYLRKPLLQGSSATRQMPVAISAVKNPPRPQGNIVAVPQTDESPEFVDLSESFDLNEVDLNEVGIDEFDVDLEVDSPSLVIVSDDVPTETITVKENENLWRFSKRVTGNALNWEKIAAFNQLGEAGAVSAGQSLRIPVEWLVPGAGN